MIRFINMPKLGLTMERGTVLQWHKDEGDWVEKGEDLLEVETDKAAVQVSSPVSGFLRRIPVRVGETVDIGRVIALFSDSADEPLSTESASSSPAPAAEDPVAPTPVGRPAAASPPQREMGGSPASPAARRRARELGVDLAGIQGTGPGGRITTEDVERASHVVTGPRDGGLAAATTKLIPLSRMRHAIARQLTHAIRCYPQFVVGVEVEMATAGDILAELRAVARKNQQVEPTITDFIILAAGRLLGTHRDLNASLVELESGDLAIEYHEAVHIGMATALPEGLVAPVIRNADHLNLSAVTAERKRLALAARQGRLAAEELSGATFTVSNLGSFGIHAFTAIINPPEAAILAVGRMADRVLARGGKPVVRPTLYLNLTVDHRLVDGATAAKFLTDLQVHLEFQERLASLIG